MRINRRLFATIAVIVFGLFVVHVPQPVHAQEAPFEINVILALTGAAAFIGKSEQQSLQFIEAITNKAGGIKGRPIKFVIVDDQSNPQVSVQLANQLISKGAPVILGPTFTSTCLAVSAIVAKSGPVEYCFSPSVTPPSGGFAYSASVATHDDLIAILRFFREKGWTRVALMTTTDASGQQAEQYFDEALTRPENKALRQVAREHFNPADLSVTAQAERIKAANPQAMVGWTAGTATGTLLRGLHDAAIDVPIVAGNGNMIHAQLQQYESFLPAQLYFAGRRALVADPSVPANIRRAQQAYFDAFKAAGTKPNIANTLSWDPALIVIDAFREKGLNATAAQINDYIQHLSRWTGINGTYDFRSGSQRGVGIDAVVMDRWDPAAKEFVVVSKPGGAL
jgi:branched-chain amino acid transport system substrate-binding protein